jgi:hypothetical protein
MKDLSQETEVLVETHLGKLRLLGDRDRMIILKLMFRKELVWYQPLEIRVLTVRGKVVPMLN